MVRARPISEEKSSTLFRSNVERHHVGGNQLAHADGLDASIGGHLVGHHVVHGQQELYVARLGVGENLRCEIDLVGSRRELPISCPCALRNV